MFDFKKDTTMKKIFITLAISAAFAITANADDRPVVFEQLPAPAQAFIKSNYPDDSVSFATVDDDIIRPDYTVVLVSGVKIMFENNGALEKIESRRGAIPEGIIPVQITDYVKRSFKDASIVEYEVGRRTYEVKLSNGLELKFNRNFIPIGIDD